jgi:hypothetical protein
VRCSPFISIVLEAEILTLRRVSALLFLEGRKQRFPSLALVGGKRTLRWVFLAIHCQSQNGASEMPSTSRLERGEKMLREVCRELAWRTEDFLGEWGGEVFRRLRRKSVWRTMVPVSSV